MGNRFMKSKSAAGFGASASGQVDAIAAQLDEARQWISQGLQAEPLEQLKRLAVPENLATIPGRAAFEELASLLLARQQWDEATRVFGMLERFQLKQKKIVKQKRVRELFNQAADAARDGRIPMAIELHCRLFGLEPNHADGLRNFTVVLHRAGAYADAELVIQKFLSLRPESPHGLNTYATVLDALGRNDEALEVLHKALAVDPSSAKAAGNLAMQYHFKALIDLAYIYSSRAIALEPDRAESWLEHLTHLRRVCAYERQAKIDWWAVLESSSVDSIASKFLQILVLAETPEQQFQLKKSLCRWGDAVTERAARSPGSASGRSAVALSINEPLRVGFVSADFRDHSVARFIWPLFEHLDRSRFQLFGYSTYTEQDAWRARFDQASTGMRDVASCSPLELGQLVREDGVHVLFDLTGFTKGSRTKAFAARLAPIQVSWLGYPGSSGLEAMDYLFLDRYLAPNDNAYLREKPLITAGTTVCFSSIPEVPITPVIPERKRGYLTFGTLNNPYKFTPATIARWCRVLQALPEAHFLFVRREFESYYLRENILAAFGRHGISAGRVHFLNNRLVGRHYLDCYNELDLTLDTYPVTGGTTTTDALWMGVPVVGLEGPNVHQRVCSAILHHAGHPEWIAQTDDEFVQIALDLAGDQDRRVQLRQSLRAELKGSLLCNARQFAADFSAAMDTLRTSV